MEIFRKGHDAWGAVGPSVRLMRGLKERFDPKRTLNPGRFVGGI
jgi:glycolate oxidase FAD binding subunit